MRRYIIAYALWFSFVATMAVVALAWYRHVEEIGWAELKRRAQEDSPEDTTGFAPGAKI